MRLFLFTILVCYAATVAGCSTWMTGYYRPMQQSPEQRRLANATMVSWLFEDSITNGIVSQRTIFPYHFLADTAQLNELGERDLHVLATYYKDTLNGKEIMGNVKVYFDYDKAQIREDAVPILDEAAQVLRKNSEADILITGHADVRGTEEYNQKLGERRSDAVRRYLLSKGIEQNRIRILSRSELDAVAPPTDIVGMQEDRNAQFVVAEVKGFRGQLSVRRANASEELYKAREAAVADFLRNEGVEVDQIPIIDGLPGGDGMDSERVLLILTTEKEAQQTTVTATTGVRR